MSDDERGDAATYAGMVERALEPAAAADPWRARWEALFAAAGRVRRAAAADPAPRGDELAAALHALAQAMRGPGDDAPPVRRPLAERAADLLAEWVEPLAAEYVVETERYFGQGPYDLEPTGTGELRLVLRTMRVEDMSAVAVALGEALGRTAGYPRRRR